MRVLELTGEPILHGGQEQFIYNFVSNLDDDRFMIDVLTPYVEDNRMFRELIESKGGRIVSFDFEFNPGKSRRLLFEPIKRFLKKNKYDIVHIHSGSISVLAYMAKAAHNAGVKKIIVHSHCTGISSLKHSLIKVSFSRMLTEYPTHYFACSNDAGRDKFSSTICDNELIIIKNGIDLDRFNRSSDIRSEVRRELGYTDDNYVIGHVGRFSFEKNHEFLIELFAEIYNTIPEARLLLIGDGELKKEIKEKVKRLDIDKAVIFQGNVDNTEAYYQAMDVFVFPSRFEGFGLVALEAQAVGIPCLISSEVPDDVLIGSNIRSLSLDEPKKWLKELNLFRNVTAVDNKATIQDAGYSIKKTVNQIKEIYLEQ